MIKPFLKATSFWLGILLDNSIDLIFKVAGTMFPLYIGAFILLLVDRGSMSNVIDPQSFVLYSSTFVFSSIYLWFKNLNSGKSKRGLLFLLGFILALIFISFLYAMSFTDKLEETFDFKFWSFAVFAFSIAIFICFECYNFNKQESIRHEDETQNEYNKLKSAFTREGRNER